MIKAFLALAMLGAIGAPGAEEHPVPAGTENQHLSELPDPECLRAIRKARIAIRLGGANSFEDAVEPCEGRFEVLHEALSLARVRGDEESELRLLERLIGYLKTNPETVSLVAVERAILDSSLEDDELRALCDHLASAAENLNATPEIWRAYAVVSGRLGDFERARFAIGRILADAPSPEVRWAAVELDQRLERWPDLVTQLELLIAEDEIMARVAKLQLVEAYARMGRLDDALSTAESLLGADEAEAGEMASDRWTVDALLQGAWALYDAGKSEDAESAFAKVAELDPDRDEVEAAVRLLYGSADERREHALETDRKLAREENPEALFEEGTRRLAVGDAAGALELLRRAAEAMTENEVAWSNFGVAALRLERWGEAARAFEHAVEMGNGDPGTRLNLGTAWVRADQCDQGMAVLDRLVNEHPELWQAQYWRWSCLSRGGSDLEAAAALRAYESGRAGASNGA